MDTVTLSAVGEVLFKTLRSRFKSRDLGALKIYVITRGLTEKHNAHWLTACQPANLDDPPF